MPSMFPCVHEVVVMICYKLRGFPKEATLPSAKELVLEKHKYGHDPITPSSLIRFIQHCFPNVSSLTFRNLDIRNPDVKIILDSLTKVTQLHSVRFTRCNTDSRVESLVQTFSEAHDLKISFEHGIPEKTGEDEIGSFLACLEDREDGDSDEETIEISEDCGYTHSAELAHLICTSPSLRVAKIGSVFSIVLEDCFFSVLAAKARDSKVETLTMTKINLLKRASTSYNLAKAICTMPHLSTLSLTRVHFHDDFYSAMSSTASSAKIGIIILDRVKLSQDHFQTFISLPKLQEVRIDRISSPEGHSLAGGCEEGNNCRSVSPASRLTIDSQTLSTWSYGHMPSKFPCVHEVVVMIYDTLACDCPEEATLPSAKELVLEKNKYGYKNNTSITTEDTPLLIGFIQHCFPNVSSLTFRDLDIENSAVEIIMDSLTKVTQLHTIRFIRCNTDRSLDSLVQAFSEKHDLKITIEHGIPEKTEYDETHSLESSEDGDSETKWNEMDSEENSEDGDSEMESKLNSVHNASKLCCSIY